MPDTTKPYKFDGFGAPQYTSVPDVLFDTLLAELENAELRVLLYIIRRTFGFKKDSDDIAISQMVDGIIKRDGTVLDRGTGLSRPTVKRALRGLVAKGIIVSARNQSANGGNDANTYALRYKNEAKDLRVTGDPTPHVSPTTPPLGSQMTPTRNSRSKHSSSNIRTAAPKQVTARATTSEQPNEAATPSSHAPMLGITVKRGGAPKAVGELLDRYSQHRPATPEQADERAAITATIESLAPELGDKAPVRSSVTRAYHLYQRSKLPLSTFVAELYGVRSSVKDIASRKPINNKMSYFFGLLEDRLGLSPAKPEAS
jgi:Bacteriophage replication protein O